MYRGGPGGEACEDERKLKNVTETVYDACHGPFSVLLGKLYLFFCCVVRSPVFFALSGKLYLFFCCLVRNNEMSGSMHGSTETK